MSSFWNRYPYSNLHGFNLDWVIDTVKSCVTDIAVVNTALTDYKLEVEETLKNYELSDNITAKRKLSENGDFTGTLCEGIKTACEVVTEIDNNSDKIDYLTSQFEDGQTGLIIDGGFFPDTEINNNYDGGIF